VALGVELGEHELLRAAFDSQPQRRGAGGGLQADRLDLGHREPELVSHGLADRLPPPAGHIHVRGAAAPVGDGERLVRVKKRNAVTGDRDGERHGQEQVIHVIDRQVQPSQTEHGDTTATAALV